MAASRAPSIIRRDGTVAATIGGLAPEANVMCALEQVQQMGAAS